MRQKTLMVRLLARSALGVFLVSVLVGYCLSWLSGRTPQPLLVGALALGAATLFTIRAYSPLRAELRRKFVGMELRRRRDRLGALGAAVNELIDAMARLSPGDLSIYGTILQTTKADDTACVITSKGSPNHHVLVQMTDLKLAAPQEFKTIGDGPHSFTSVRYELTPFGLGYLAKLMADVLERRDLLSGVSGSRRI